MAELLHRELTHEIIGGCYAVYRVFGYGFLEDVYKNALAVELARRGLTVKREVPIEITYLGVPVGAYRIDLLVNDSVIVEVKSHSVLTRADQKQLNNYLKATDIEVGLIFNFGPEPQVDRIVLSNSRKEPSV